MTQPLQSNQQPQPAPNPVTPQSVLAALNTQDAIASLHRLADTDVNTTAQHHTLGIGDYNAASGVHVHDGVSGRFLNGLALPPSVTGSRGANAALASLLTQLASMGIIINNTT